MAPSGLNLGSKPSDCVLLCPCGPVLDTFINFFNILNSFKNVYLLTLREIECVCVSRGGAEREGERASRAGSVLPAQSLTRDSIPRTMKSQLEMKSRVR